MTIPTVTPLPDPPDPATPATFSSLAATFVLAMKTFATELIATISSMNSTAADVDADAVSAAADAATATTKAAEATASALTAVNAPGTSATSTTSLAIQTTVPATVSLTIQAGKSLQAGMMIMMASTASPENWESGPIVSYNSGTGALVFTAAYSQGIGTFAAWTVSLAPPVMSTVSNAVRASISSAYTMTAQDIGSEQPCTGTFTLSFVAAATLGNGWYAIIRNDGTGTVTLDPSGTETINTPATTFALQRGQSVYVTCDGAGLLAKLFASAPPTLKVSDQKASGTAGGSSLAADITQVRTLNTTDINTIAGASLAANEITLPAGTYDALLRAPGYQTNGHKAFLYNTTDSTYTLIGSGSLATAATAISTDSIVMGQFTITSAKNFKLRHYTAAVRSTDGLGVAITSGQVEVYSEAIFKKVA